MFKDFDISFVDKDDKPLDIIVLAGVNGSGKTTLLEFVKDFETLGYFNMGGQYLDVEYQNNIHRILSANETTNPELYEYNFFSENIRYFSTGSDKIENIKETIRQKYIDRAFEIDKPSEALRELQNYIKNIFDGLDLTFNLSSIDYNKKEVLFEDNNGVKFDIDELSTGEKTLLSKVLYLYFKDYQDKVILIDEPELSLHPKWQNQVLKIYENFAKKNDCQIIIATHSPHIIGSAKPKYLRVLKKVEDKIEVVEYTQSYGLEFSQILTNIMGVDYLRTPEVAKKMDRVKEMIVQNEYDTDEFKEEWSSLEDMLGKKYLDLKLLKLEIASRRKHASSK
jgi:predicted ATP-binding protein involved in virulence